MTIPDYQTIMLPLLREMVDGQNRHVRDLTEALAEHFALTPGERLQLLPSGAQPTFDNRVAWARTYLSKAGLLERFSRGVYRITDRGLQVLESNPSKIDNSFLEQFPEFRAFRTRRSSNAASPSLIPNSGSPDGAIDFDTPPVELLESSYEQLRAQLAQELLDEVKASPPSFFERIVIDLLVAMGYGGSHADAAQAVGRSGDGGIDGIIKEDRLGLDAVYIQAKRWENAVGRPVVQGFAGSLEGQRARKGVMITTSEFSRGAHEYVGVIEKRIVLIDGERLAELMIDYGIGVTEVASYTVHRVDSDYFSDE